jgi:hypothetical protein
MSNEPFPNGFKNQLSADQSGDQQAASQGNSKMPPDLDWREMRHATRRARIEKRRMWRGNVYGWGGYGWGWAFGVVLVLIGLVFLFQNLTGYNLVNWWALFILIPAFGFLEASWISYRNARHITVFARNS